MARKRGRGSGIRNLRSGVEKVLDLNDVWATITWQTTQPATAQVEYRRQPPDQVVFCHERRLQWITIDLGKVKQVGCVGMEWEYAYARD